MSEIPPGLEWITRTPDYKEGMDIPTYTQALSDKISRLVGEFREYLISNFGSVEVGYAKTTMDSLSEH